MRYTLHGRIDGQDASVTWDDGVIQGSVLALGRALVLVDLAEPVGLPGLAQGTATLAPDKPVLAHATLYAAFDEVIGADGDLPGLPPLPDGAVA